ncbi:MAG: hypothetical protein PVG92_09035 [Holophagae bacterium]
MGIDAFVNLILGGLLLLFPAGVLDFLRLPQVSHHFYTSILGAVIFGIGLALLVDLFGADRGIRGLGLAGAITINLCGGGALLLWLLFHPFDIPARGQAVLWSVAIIVLGIGTVELGTGSWRRSESRVEEESDRSY